MQVEKFLKNFIDKYSNDSLSRDDCYELVSLSLVENEEYCLYFLKRILSDFESELAIDLDNTNDENISYIAELIFNHINANVSLRNLLGINDDVFTLVVKNIVCLFKQFINYSIGVYSLAKLLVFSICVDLMSYIEKGDVSFEEIAESFQFLFNDGTLAIREDNYDVTEIFDLNNLNSCESVFGAVLVAYSYIFAIDNPNVSNDEILNSIYQKEPEIKALISKIISCEVALENEKFWFDNAKKFLNNADFINKICHLELDEFCPESSFLDLNRNNFLDQYFGFDISPEKMKNFLHEVDSTVDHKKEHDDYLNAMSQKWLIMMDNVKNNFPKLNEDTIKQFENSNEPDLIEQAATCYFFGIFVGRDFEKAYSLFKKVSECGESYATYVLSLMYLKSLHVSYDTDKFLFYLVKACELGEKEALDQWKDLVFEYRNWNGSKDNTEEDFINAILVRLKDDFLTNSNQIIGDYKKFDTNYYEDVAYLFGRKENFKYAEKLCSTLKDFELSEKQKISEIYKNLKQMFKLNPYVGNIHFNYAKSAFKVGPSLCWQLLAFDKGLKVDLEEIFGYYGDKYLEKNEFIDKKFYEIVKTNHDFKLIEKYNLNDFNFITNLFESGFEECSGLLIEHYLNNNDLDKTIEMINLFSKSANDNQKKYIITLLKSSDKEVNHFIAENFLEGSLHKINKYSLEKIINKEDKKKTPQNKKRNSVILDVLFLLLCIAGLVCGIIFDISGLSIASIVFFPILITIVIINVKK